MQTRPNSHIKFFIRGGDSYVSESISVEPTAAHGSEVAAVGPVCPVCGRESRDGLAPFGQLTDELQRLVAANAPGGEAVPSVCLRCVELFGRARRQLEKYAEIFEQGRYVLPTYLRLDADERFTGRGVTIAFLDSGFYSHPDLVTPRSRILAYHNVTQKGTGTLESADVASWHGMMTSVVAAGNGSLSHGFFRGMASESDVALVKVSRSGHISEKNIKLGLDWVLENRERYQIRVVNISAGGDAEQSYLDNALCQTVERAVREGLVVVCAVGNAGHEPGHPVIPPASAPSCIAVGGLDDKNSRDRGRAGMYRSSYGPTYDGLQKPELIAPGIWVPAPILPHTPTAAEAELYATLDRAADAELPAIIEEYKDVDRDIYDARALPTYLLRQLIMVKLHESDVISEHYKFVDGTSFAAPIVSSVAACMLEANPHLSPQQVKRILIDTAERLPHIEIDRQGWGVVAPRRAVEVALALRPHN
jgi:serine protease AprX